MTTYMLHVEETDQTFPIPADIGASDDLIKRALAGVVPYIDTAKLTREEKDGVTTIKVIKSHAPKGAGNPGSSLLVILSLAKARRDGTNPVASLYRHLVHDGVKLETLKPDQHLALSSMIDKTIEAGEPEAQFERKHFTLAGDLSAVSVFDAVQVLENARLNGVLTISGEGHAGQVKFNDGRIVDAACDGEIGELGFQRVVEITSGTFEFQKTEEQFPTRIQAVSNTNLILDTLRLLDERKQ